MSNCIGAINPNDRKGGLGIWIRRLLGFEVTRKSAIQLIDKKSCSPQAASTMLMTSRDIGPLIARTADRLAEWQTRHATRRQLIALDDHLLKDIGINRCDAEREYRKPFWRF